MREKDIENKVCDYARQQGLLVYKFTSPARASVPDRMFVTPNGTIFFVEFKRPGGQCTPGQEREIARLRGHKVNVAVVDCVEDGMRLIDLLK